MHRARVWTMVVSVAAGLLASPMLADPAGAARPRGRGRGRPPPERRQPAQKPAEQKEEPMPVIDPALLGEEPGEDEVKRRTCVSIEEQAFLINEHPTYRGRMLKRGKGEEAEEHKIEGLLFNARLANAVFDDLNPDTRTRWKYPDGPWDADRNTDAFLDAMPYWRRSGLAAFTVNLQGGSPDPESRAHPWINSAFTRDGRLRADYMKRLERVIDRADELGMVVILGFFDWGQDQRIWDERSVVRAVDAVTDWLLGHKYTNVLVEICSACGHRQYDHEILSDDRVHELVERVQGRSEGKVDSPAERLLVSASMDGGTLPPHKLLRVADFALLHGDGVSGPDRIARMVRHTRGRMGGAAKPVLFNKDDHYDFEADENHMMAAALEYAGWGFHDYRREGEGFRQGFQSMPADWGVNSLRKYRFFSLLAKLTRHSRPYLSHHVREEIKARKKKERSQSRSRAPEPATSTVCSGGRTGPALLDAGRVALALWLKGGRHYQFLDAGGRAVALAGFGRVQYRDAKGTHPLREPDVTQSDEALVLTFHPLEAKPRRWLRVTVRSTSDGGGLDFSYEAAEPKQVERVRLLGRGFHTGHDPDHGVVVPVREGLLIPSNTGKTFRHTFDTYAYEGCHMAMVGAVDDDGAFLICWDDPYVSVEVESTYEARSPECGTKEQQLTLALDLRKSARRLRVRYLPRGDAVSVAKAYRNEAKRAGWFVPWEAKLQKNPGRRKFFGAVNYKLWSMLSRRMNEASTEEQSVRVNWTFDQAARVAEHLRRDLDLERVLFIMGGWIRRGYDNQHPDILPAAPECGGNEAFADACKRIRALGYLLCLHDNYQDMYRDSPSWDEKYLMRRPDGSLAKGGRWAGGRAYLTCSRMALELAKRPQNLPAVRELTRADAYFIDTTFAAGLQECYAKAHPLTRLDDMRWKQALCDYAREVFGSFGSECGREWGVPHAEFFEGLAGVSGRYYHDKNLLAKLGAVPFPLFEVVYRPCIQIYGKYGYDIHRSAEYVLHHIRLGRPMHYHGIPSGLYWKGWSGKPESKPVLPKAAEVEPLGGRRLRITYHWKVEGPVGKDWTVFVHFTDPAGHIRFQNDHVPRPGTSAWPVGEHADGPHVVTVPKGMRGEFDVRVGFFSRPSLGRVSLLGTSDGERRYTVGRLKVAGDAVTFTPVQPERAREGGDPALFTRAGGGWAEGKHPLDAYVKNTYEVLSPLNELTARMPMEEHGFLTADRNVVRSVFGTGKEAVTAVVNMGREPFRLRSDLGGEVVLPACGFLVEAPTFVAFYASTFGGLRYADAPLMTVRSLDGKALAESGKVRVYHGFGDPRIRFRGRHCRVVREETLAF